MDSYLNSTHRIDYLDLLKGFAILWIIWYHVPHPEFVDYYYHVPIFFFISGLLYKQKTFIQLINNLSRKVLVPFLFFYFISYFFQIFRYLFENDCLAGFNWYCFFDVFSINSRGDYLSINIPLWFLICMIDVQILYYLISKLPRIIIIVICLTIVLFKEKIISISTPFMLNQAFFWVMYFALGDIFGKKLINHITIPIINSSIRGIEKQKQFRIISLIIGFCLWLIFRIVLHKISNPFLDIIINELLVLVFIITSIILFSFIQGDCLFVRILRFYGKNTLIVLGLHWLLIIFYGGVFYRLFGIELSNLLGICIVIISVVTLYPIILFLNKYLSSCIGKSKIRQKVM